MRPWLSAENSSWLDFPAVGTGLPGCRRLLVPGGEQPERWRRVKYLLRGEPGTGRKPPRGSMNSDSSRY